VKILPPYGQSDKKHFTQQLLLRNTASLQSTTSRNIIQTRQDANLFIFHINHSSQKLCKRNEQESKPPCFNSRLFMTRITCLQARHFSVALYCMSTISLGTVHMPSQLSSSSSSSSHRPDSQPSPSLSGLRLLYAFSLSTQPRLHQQNTSLSSY